MSKAQYDQITYNLKDLSNEERNNVLLKATMDTNGLLNADKIYNKAKEFLPKNIQMNPILDAEPIEVLTSATLLKEMEILDKKRKIKNPLTLYITKQFISIGGFTYTNMDKMLVGTINKGYINFIESYINSIPNYLFQGFNAR
ncbi:MAG: hypothetical protein LBV53_01290 [Mycoplasmataceae bacterium]|jgi:sulfatase maturation enzyme AslB (radical SAM superfamily)|nr:hypothetical protein [Mycoplasmataceae bacterium]